MLSTHQSDLFAQLLVRASFNSKEFSESLVLCFVKLVHMIVVQFSMSFVSVSPWRTPGCLLVGSLFIISQSLPFVKRFFKTFLSFFRGSLRFLVPLADSLYIISQPLSFVKRFLKLFSFFSSGLPDLPSRLTASILYHNHSHLSIPFLNLFQLFSIFSTASFPTSASRRHAFFSVDLPDALSPSDTPPYRPLNTAYPFQ